LQGINGRLDILLVIHGSTDLSDDQFRKLIVNGAKQD